MPHVVSKDGTRIAYEKTGEGPAVLLVDGAMGYREHWGGRQLAAALSKEFTVYTYDRRGRGESTDTQPYAVEREIEDIEALIEEAGGPVHLFGISSGAVLALKAAARLGAARVAKLALYEPPITSGDEARRSSALYTRQLTELLEADRRGDAVALFNATVGLPAEMIESMRHSPDWPIMEALAPTLAYDNAIMGDGSLPADAAGAATKPALVLVGSESPPFMLEAAEALARAMPHAERKTLEGQTHEVSPEVLAPVLAEFFSQARQAQQPPALDPKLKILSGPLTGPDAAAGPLVVSRVNPRYFIVASDNADDRKVVYLTGSHIWNNFHDGLGPGTSCADMPEQNDYRVYLDFLKDHGHNFIRLWRWEHFRSQAAGGNFHLCMTPQPWPRTGPGAATDGKPKFDLSRFDQAYFDRLRYRVTAAGNKGIYVAVMLFDGFCLHLCPSPDNVRGHPFHTANNVNDIGIASILDYQVLPLHPRIQALQEAYMRKVVDTVHDLKNVLYEVANESSGDNAEFVLLPDGSSIPTPVGDSTRWQYWVIDYVKQYEQQMGYDKHPIGMTMQYPVPDQSKVNDPLFNGPADWISPGFDDELFSGRWFTNPPANDGRKVVITDTDHYAPGRGDAMWAWKSFLRGHNPILMDFGIIDIANPLDPSLGIPSYESFEPARFAMGDTLRFARRMNLVEMEPRGDLSSTGYALANPGREYLVLQRGETADPFSVMLDSSTYAVEWYSVNSREAVRAGEVTVEGAAGVNFSAPYEAAGPAVLYLKKV